MLPVKKSPSKNIYSLFLQSTIETVVKTMSTSKSNELIHSQTETDNKMADAVKVFSIGKKNDLSFIFLFSSPNLYFEGIKILNMLISLYYACWMMDFLPSSHLSVTWKIISFLPIVLSFINFLYITKCAVLLKGVYTIDKDSMVEAIEQAEEARELEDMIRHKLLGRLPESSMSAKADIHEELYKLFQEIDVDDDKFLCMYLIYNLFTRKIL
jgi:hypothetical protein